MAKLRVYELARELGVESKEVLERAQDLGVAVKTASSGLDEEAVELLRLAVEETAPAAAEPEDEVTGEVGAEEEAPTVAAPPAELTELEVRSGLSVAEFAELVDQPVAAVVEALADMGEVSGAPSPVPAEAVELLGESYGFAVSVTEAPVPEAPLPEPRRIRPVFDDDESVLEPRPAVVTVMGHVDHGKTQLLDTIRQANVIAGEAGGITQHIGAYQVSHDGGRLTFIDTPGHEAFTALRARGADVTDIVILVVAADDGVMPQTIEAISHANAAGVPIVVAINKIDLDSADAYGVRAQLTEQGVVVEELGGEVPSAEISALTSEGVDHLIEVVELVAELEELKANPAAPASGVVIESQLDRGRGPVATVVVQRGTLQVGDPMVAGGVSGRVRAMFDENGKQVKKAPPSTPVLVMGWDEVPEAGDYFQVADDEKAARAMAEGEAKAMRAERLVVPTSQERLAQLLEQLRTSDVTELRVIIKADTHGSLEAIRDAVSKIAREDGRVVIVHGAVGGINEQDVVLADVSESIVLGFNVRPDAPARRATEQRGIEVRAYRVIYELLDEVEQMLVGQLAPEEEEVLLGVAEVRATFRAPRFGTVAGCYVTEGEMARNAKVRLIRDGVVVYEGTIGSLRRFKDDVASVAAGFECGVGLDRFRDIKEGDVIESYVVREVART